jgi:y4mF family transcriptional regulator
VEKISQFVKVRRQKLGLTQEQIAEVSGVGLRFIRDLEQETKGSFRLDKVNQVLALFGYQLGPVPKPKKAE